MPPLLTLDAGARRCCAARPENSAIPTFLFRLVADALTPTRCENATYASIQRESTYAEACDQDRHGFDHCRQSICRCRRLGCEDSIRLCARRRPGKISSTRSRSLRGKDNGYFMRTSVVTLAFAHVTTTSLEVIVLLEGPSPCCLLLVETTGVCSVSEEYYRI